MSELKKIIEHTLKDVHIETGRKDEYERLVNDLLLAMSSHKNQILDEAIAEIADINPHASMSNNSNNMQEVALQAVRNLKGDL